MLTRIGPSAMTMDMVSRNCGISKRTLYETFPDKRTLVMECIKVDQTRHNQEFREIFETASNCFDALFKAYLKVRRYLQNTSATFMDELKRIYPDVHAEREQNEKRLVLGLSKVIKRAQDEGHVIKGVNTDIAAFLFFSTMRNVEHSERLRYYEFDKVDVFDGAFLNFMRGMATIEGINYINEMIDKAVSSRQHE